MAVVTWPRFIVLHNQGHPFYVRPDKIIRLDAHRNGGSVFSIGTDFAQVCDEDPLQLLRLIEGERG